MTLTKRQKSFYGLLCAGLGALALDRMFFEGGPQRAPASVARVAPAAPRTAASTPPPVVSLAAADRVSKRLDALDIGPGNTVDGFALSTAWRAAAHPPPPPPPAPPPIVDLSTVHFASRHKLSAVLTQRDGGGEAIVDGVTLRLGQRLDGFVLSRIAERSVRFVSGAGAVDLHLAP